jgi:hypothetical protein
MAGCGKSEYETELTGGLWLKMGDNSIVSTSDIDYYDVSTHMIYLKKELPYLKKVEDSFGGIMSVYVGDDEIYKCSPDFGGFLLSCTHNTLNINANYF